MRSRGGGGGKEGKCGGLKAKEVKIWSKKRWSKVNCNKEDSAGSTDLRGRCRLQRYGQIYLPTLTDPSRRHHHCLLHYTKQVLPSFFYGAYSQTRLLSHRDTVSIFCYPKLKFINISNYADLIKKANYNAKFSVLERSKDNKKITDSNRYWR